MCAVGTLFSPALHSLACPHDGRVWRQDCRQRERASSVAAVAAPLGTSTTTTAVLDSEFSRSTEAGDPLLETVACMTVTIFNALGRPENRHQDRDRTRSPTTLLIQRHRASSIRNELHVSFQCSDMHRCAVFGLNYASSTPRRLRCSSSLFFIWRQDETVVRVVVGSEPLPRP